MKCNDCGKDLLIDTSKILSSYPPQYETYCENCKKTSYINCDKYRSYIWSNNTYGTSGNILDKTLDEVKGKEPDCNIGWECPKCGSVLAPWQSYCPFCSNNKWELTC